MLAMITMIQIQTMKMLATQRILIGGACTIIMLIDNGSF